MAGSSKLIEDPGGGVFTGEKDTDKKKARSDFLVGKLKYQTTMAEDLFFLPSLSFWNLKKKVKEMKVG